MKFFSVYIDYSFDDDEIFYLYNSRDDGRAEMGSETKHPRFYSSEHILFSSNWEEYLLKLKEHRLNTKRSFTADII